MDRQEPASLGGIAARTPATLSARSILAARLLAVACLLVPTSSASRTLHVPGDDTTIAGALGRAVAGDTVIVAPGRYAGGLRVPDGVALIGQAGPDSTILDGGGRGPVVTFEGVGPATLLEGFTVTGGLLNEERGDGAGIRCSRHAAPRINHNRIVGNRALGEDGRGGGIACLDGASPAIANNHIENNEAAIGGGIYIGRRRGAGFDSSPAVGGNWVVRNRARRHGGGMAITHSSEPAVSLNIVGWNTALEGGGGIAIERAIPQIMQNVIWANSDSTAGVAAGILLADYAAPHIERNIIAKNRGGPGMRCERQFQERQAVRCNVVWGHDGGNFSEDCTIYPGNLDVDPELCDPENGRFELRPKSPCRDAPGCGRIGAFGPGCR